MKTVLIGTPIYNRAWILPEYLRCLKNQKFNDKIEIEYVFVDGDSKDNTVQLLKDFGAEVFRTRIGDGHTTERNWSKERIEFITALKNKLLHLVRIKYKPDYFFALDSDVLLASENCIQALVNDEKDAVGPLCFTGEREHLTNILVSDKAGMINLKRKNFFSEGKIFRVDGIMSAILMSRHFYEIVEYKYHSRGEEVGLALKSKEKGLNIFCDSTIDVRHVWSPKHLESLRIKNDISYDIIIISYNAKEYLIKCLNSLKLINPKKIIIIDNASTDGSQEYLEGFEKDNAKVILNKENLGYGVSCNQAAKLCDSPIIGFCNMDVEFVENIQLMVNYLNNNRDIAIIGPKQVNAENKIIHAGIQTQPNAEGIHIPKAHIGWLEEDKGQFNEIKEFNTINGACFFIKRSVFNKCRGFLETRHFFEESFLCYKARHFGYKVVYFGKTKIIHYWRKSKTKMNLSKVFQESKEMFIKEVQKLNEKKKFLNIGILLVKDEEDIVEEVINSYLPYVDAIYALDNSSDKTFEILKTYKKIVFLGKDRDYFEKSTDSMRQLLLEKAWNDFGRDFNGWFTILHGDEIFVDNPREFAKQADMSGAEVTAWNRVDFFLHSSEKESFFEEDLSKSSLQRRKYCCPGFIEFRQFKNSPDISYVKEKHKMVIPSGVKLSGGLWDRIGVLKHYVYRSPEQMKKKLGNNKWRSDWAKLPSGKIFIDYLPYFEKIFKLQSGDIPWEVRQYRLQKFLNSDAANLMTVSGKRLGEI